MEHRILLEFSQGELVAVLLAMNEGAGPALREAPNSSSKLAFVETFNSAMEKVVAAVQSVQPELLLEN